MQAAGVQPGGDVQEDGTRAWTQAVPLLRSDIAGAPKLSVSVDGKPRPLTQGGEIAVRAAMDGSRSVEIVGAPTVFVGHGVLAPGRGGVTFTCAGRKEMRKASGSGKGWSDGQTEVVG